MKTLRFTRRNWLKMMTGSVVCGLAACAPRVQPDPPAAPVAPSVAIDTKPAEKPAVQASTAMPPKIVATVAPTVAPVAAVKPVLPDGPVAPPIISAVWLNTPANQPLAWDTLRGQVAMVEFWTIGCINCQHVIHSMISMYADYKARGFTILGVHSPEFDYEKDLANVKASVKKWGIKYPVAIDNDFENWNRYRNRYWPARYLVDKRGIVRHTHIGEGGDEEIRQWIEQLLGESA